MDKLNIVQKMFQDYFDSLSNDIRVSGVMFIINNAAICVLVESTTKVLFQLLRILQGKEPLPTPGAESTNHSAGNSPKLSSHSSPSLHPHSLSPPVASKSYMVCPLKNPKICSFTEEVPREYNIWGVRAVRLAADEWSNPKEWLKTVFESLKNLLELGRELVGLQEEKAADFIVNSTSRQLLNRIPSFERIQAFSTLDDLFNIQGNGCTVCFASALG